MHKQADPICRSQKIDTKKCERFGMRGAAAAALCPDGSAGLTKARYESGNAAAYQDVTCVYQINNSNDIMETSTYEWAAS